jgi:dipeptide/tripeptide permease
MVGAALLAAVVYRRPPGARPERAGPVDLARLRSRMGATSYRLALAGYPLLWAWYFVLSAGLVDLLTTAGIDRTVAATAFGTIGGVSVAGRLASGWLADRVGARETFTGGVVLAALGLLALTAVETRLSMYATLVVFGAGLGVIATLFSPVVIRQFGPEDATAVVGSFNVAEAAGAFLAPLGVNWAVQATGGYTLPMVALAGLTLAGAGLFYWGTDPRRAPDG